MIIGEKLQWQWCYWSPSCFLFSSLSVCLYHIHTLHVHAGQSHRKQFAGPELPPHYSYVAKTVAAISRFHDFAHRRFTGRTSKITTDTWCKPKKKISTFKCLRTTIFTVSEWRPWWKKPLCGEGGVKYIQMKLWLSFDNITFFC